jgi:hypothetical protein
MAQYPPVTATHCLGTSLVPANTSKLAAPRRIFYSDAGRFRLSYTHEHIDEHGESAGSAGMHNVRAPRLAVPCCCRARIRRSGPQRAESQICVAGRVRNVSRRIGDSSPENGSRAERTALPPRDTRRPLMSKLSLPAAWQGPKKLEPNFVETSPITMPPGCGASCVLPFAPHSCPAKSSSLVKKLAVRSDQENIQ